MTTTLTFDAKARTSLMTSLGRMAEPARDYPRCVSVGCPARYTWVEFPSRKAAREALAELRSVLERATDESEWDAMAAKWLDS